MEPVEAPQPPAPGKPERSVADATRDWRARFRLRRLIQEGRLTEALNFANKLITENPTNWNAWHEKATAQFFLHDYPAAQASYDTLLGFDPRDRYALTGKGLCYCDTNEFGKALKYFQQAAEVAPEDAIVWEQMGRAHAGLGEHEAALEALQQAIRINNEFVEAWHWLGQELQALGRYNDALQCFDIALCYDPENADAWNDRGALFFAETNRLVNGGESASQYRVVLFREAVRSFDIAVSLKPDHGNALKNLKQLERFNELRALASVDTPVGLGLFHVLSEEVPARRLTIPLQDGVAKIPTTGGLVTVRASYPARTGDEAQHDGSADNE